MMSNTAITRHGESDSARGIPAIAPPIDGIIPPLPTLSADQIKALELIMSGMATGKVAVAVGVDRGTIYRWKRYDANFIAALNQWRGDIHREIRDRVLTVAELATDAVEHVVKEKEGRLGLRLLEKTGCLKVGPKYPVDPYEVFGMGLEDEAVRGPVGEGFQLISSLLTREMRIRGAQLLALGVAIDDLLAGRSTPREILEMAGPLPPKLLETDGTIAGGVAAGSLRTNDPLTEIVMAGDSSADAPAVEGSCQQAKARAAGYSNKGSWQCARGRFGR